MPTSDFININGFIFEKATKQILKKITTENIYALSLSSPGAMGYSQSACVITKKSNELKSYFFDLSQAEILNLLKEKFLLLDFFYPHPKNTFPRDIKWKYINMGVGNKLLIPLKLSTTFNTQITNHNPAYIYQNWPHIINKILNEKS